MASEPKTIAVEPGSKADLLLAEAQRAPLRLVRAGKSFRLDQEHELRGNVESGSAAEPANHDLNVDQPTHSISSSRQDAHASPVPANENDIWAQYDPEAARTSTLAFAGSCKDIDTEAFKAYIRERRRTKNRPSVRW